MTTSETLERPPASLDNTSRPLQLHNNDYQDDDDNDYRLAINLVVNICVRIVFVH